MLCHRGDSGHHSGMPTDLFEDTTKQIEAEDFIEAAYLAGIIDGDTQELAYLWLANNHQGVHCAMIFIP